MALNINSSLHPGISPSMDLKINPEMDQNINPGIIALNQYNYSKPIHDLPDYRH